MRTYSRKWLINVTILGSACVLLTGCSQQPMPVRQQIKSFNEFGMQKCGPLFVDPEIAPDEADPMLGCATQANLRNTIVNPSDLSGRYRYPYMEGNRAINPVARMKGSPESARGGAAMPGDPTGAGTGKTSAAPSPGTGTGTGTSGSGTGSAPGAR